jgi:PPP family 3-phenylpropionic acid transporter
MGTAAAIGAIMEVPLLFFFDNVRKRVSVTVLLKVCEVAFVLKFLILVLADNVFMVCLSQVLQGIYILIVPGMVYLIGATMAPGEAVKGQTWYVVSTTVASVLASFAGGWILDLAGAKALCLVGLVLAAAGCLIFFLIVDKVAAGNHEA